MLKFNLRFGLLFAFLIVLFPAIFQAQGVLDHSFGNGGKVITKIGTSSEQGYATALQSDGKIIAAGTSSSRLVVARINSDGSLDRSFGVDGKAIVSHCFNFEFGFEVSSAVVQSDGKIIVGGTACSSFTLVRFNSDGSLDTTFDMDGIVSTSFENQRVSLQSLALQPDGKIVAAGFEGRFNSSFAFVVTRYNVDGSLDNSFDGDGRMLFDSDNQYPGSAAHSVLIQADGKILIGGIGGGGFRIIRLNTNGSFDSGFGTNGRVTTLIERYDTIYALALQSDGKIVAVGTDGISSYRNVIIARYNPNGSLDTTFGMQGIAKIIIEGSFSGGADVAIQNDGKIVVSGSAYDFNLVRYNSDGTLDTSFGDSGKVITAIGDFPKELLIQPDGKIVLVGSGSYNTSVPPPTSQIALARYNSDGSLDNSFDVDGIAFVPANDSDNGINDIAIQADGKIVAVGYGQGRRITLARYNTNGSLDNTFGTGGIVISVTINVNARSVLIQPDGKILVGGEEWVPFHSGLPSLPQFAVFRYNPDGSVDNTFGSDGKVVVRMASNGSSISGLALQSDGKIVACGTSHFPSPSATFSAIRLNNDGSLDTTFDGDGKVFTTIGSNRSVANDVVIQSDGKIIVAGSASDTNAGSKFAVVRYNTDGSLDTTFDADGKLTTSFGESSDNANDSAHGVKIQKDGKIVTAGNAGGKFALTRYNTNGSLDNSFGDGGKVLTSVGRASGIRDLEIQPNGKLVVAGFSRSGANSDSTIARYNANGALDGAFGNNGVVITPIMNLDDEFLATALQSDGKIVAGGFGFNTDNIDFTLARYQSDTANSPTPFDFDGDGKSDITVFRPSNRVWYLLNSKSGFSTVQFGISTDKLAPADFDGDGKTDVAVFRPLNGEWSILRSSDNSVRILNFGMTGDLPRPGDFDGDGKADIAVFRPSNGIWYWLNSSNGEFNVVQFGTNGDNPLIADFDGDGKLDIAVFRPSNGTWYSLRSSDSRFNANQFGTNGDIPVVADFDGDGKSDIVVWRPSNGVWYRLNSSNGQFNAVPFGTNGDIPVAADYDGDGLADIAVWRPSDGVWYLLQSKNGFAAAQFGMNGDVPLTTAYAAQ